MRLRSEINLRSQILKPYRTVLRTLRGHDADTTRNLQGVPRAVGLGINDARPGARRGVGEKGSDRITKVEVDTAVPTIRDDSTTRRALRPRWRTGAFDGGDDSVGGTRDGDGTWTEMSKGDGRPTSTLQAEGMDVSTARNWEMRARAPMTSRGRCGSMGVCKPRGDTVRHLASRCPESP